MAYRKVNVTSIVRALAREKARTSRGQHRSPDDNYYHRPFDGYRDERRYGETPNDRYYSHPELVQKKIKDGSALRGKEFDPYRKPKPSLRPRTHVGRPQAPDPLPPIPGYGRPNQASGYYHYAGPHLMPYEGIGHEGGGGTYQTPAPHAAPRQPAGDYGFGRQPTFVNPAPEALYPLQPLKPTMLGGPDMPQPNDILSQFVSSHYSPAIQQAVLAKLLRNQFVVPQRLRQSRRRRSSGPIPFIEE
jgi:hypothetical protein